MKFTVRLSAFPGGTVDFFDLLRRTFNTESITRLVRLKQMLSVFAMLANLQKSSKVPSGKADSCTCKVHSGRIKPDTGNIFLSLILLFLRYVPFRRYLYLHDKNSREIKIQPQTAYFFYLNFTPSTPSALPPDYPLLLSYREGGYIFPLKAQIPQEVVFLFL